jgi:hypothetical protein
MPSALRSQPIEGEHMQSKTSGKKWNALIAAGVAGVLLLGAQVKRAEAGCAPPKLQTAPTAWEWAEGLRVQHVSADASSEFAPFMRREPIVGLWQFTFLSGTTVMDHGYVQWHSDGTEIMNSGRPPLTQSFCLGAWEQIGRRTFKLNHFAMSWDDTGTVYIGPTNIREEVTVNEEGNKYTGTWSLTQYATDGKTVLGSGNGTVTATRITAD